MAAADVVPTDGTATFTDLTGPGTCSFVGEPADNLHVGLSSAEYGTADVCGAYLEVVGPQGTVQVQITDHCPRCRPGLIDITRRAFGMIADTDQGRVPVSYRLVVNPPLAASISLRVKAGSSPSWLEIQALDHGNPIAGLELFTAAGWRSLVHTSDNFWAARDPGPGEGPFTVRITDVNGQSVTVDGVVLAPGEVQPTGARLYPASAAPGPPAGSQVPAPSATTVPVGASPDLPGNRADEGGTAAASSADTDDTPTAGQRGPDDGGSGGPIGSLFVVLVAALVTWRLVAAWRRRGDNDGRAIDRWPRRWPSP